MYFSLSALLTLYTYLSFSLTLFLSLSLSFSLFLFFSLSLLFISQAIKNKRSSGKEAPSAVTLERSSSKSKFSTLVGRVRTEIGELKHKRSGSNAHLSASGSLPISVPALASAAGDAEKFEKKMSRVENSGEFSFFLFLLTFFCVCSAERSAASPGVRLEAVAGCGSFWSGSFLFFF